jgi:polar amino acid transport system substrate-binding protein
MKLRRIIFHALAAGLFLAYAEPLRVAAEAQPAADPRIAEIVKAGKIRVGLFVPQFTKDSATGEHNGVWAESARSLAARMGVQPVLLEHATPPEAIACLKDGRCDLLYLPLDDRAADVGDFSPPIFQFDYTLLVPADSAIQTVADADRPGVRIAAVRNHASTSELSRRLKHAEMAYADTPEPTFGLLRNGQAAAMASARNTLLAYADRLPSWTTAMERTSTVWSSPRAKQNGLPTSASSSRRPRPPAWCSRSSTAPGPHSTFTPMARMSLPYLSWSRRMRAANSSTGTT